MDLAAELTIPTPPTPTAAPSSTPSDAPTPPTTEPETPVAPLDLEQELATVIAGFGSFWGRVRKQSAAVLSTAEKQIDTARKDLTPFVAQARANLDSFGETTKAELLRLSEAGNSTSGVMIGADGTPIIMDDYIKVDNKGKGVDRTPEDGDGETEKSASDINPAAAAAAFFTKMQSQLSSNANVQELSKNFTTLQSTVSSNLSHLPTSLQSNLTSLQSQFTHLDLSDSQKVAESYLHKGETWFSEFSVEVSRLAKDAVKVFPPTTKRDERIRAAEQVSVGRRAMLLQRLRSDSAMLLVDPARPSVVGDALLSSSDPTIPLATPSDTREAFSVYLQGIEDDGGFEGSSWTSAVAKELDAAGRSGETGLGASLAKLVPETLTAEAFWSRYFFRVSQIDADEARRKAVIEVAAGEEEDFSWDADEEPPSSPLPSSTALPSPLTPKQSAPPTSSTAPTSPRASSDGTSSYDVVGMTSGNASGVEHEVEKKEEQVDEGEDSDWE